MIISIQFLLLVKHALVVFQSRVSVFLQKTNKVSIVQHRFLVMWLQRKSWSFTFVSLEDIYGISKVSKCLFGGYLLSIEKVGSSEFERLSFIEYFGAMQGIDFGDGFKAILIFLIKKESFGN